MSSDIGLVYFIRDVAYNLFLFTTVGLSVNILALTSSIECEYVEKVLPHIF